MICPNCGKEIPDGSFFCGECGSEVKNVAEEVKAEESVVEAKKEETPVVAEPVKEEANEPEGTVETEKPEENNTLSIIALIIAIVGLALIFVKGYLTGVAGIVAIIMGALGRKQGARSIGTASMIIGIIDVVVVALWLIAVVGIAFFALAVAVS